MLEYKNEKAISKQNGNSNESVNVDVNEWPWRMKNTEDRVIEGESQVDDKLT